MSQVMTVLGPVDPATLGVTLSHEHLLIDLTGYVERPRAASAARFTDEEVQMDNLERMRRNPYANLDNCMLGDIDTAIAEISQFQRLGGQTVVDVTNPDIGRDAAGLREISLATGLNVIAGCGHYVHAAHRPELSGMTVTQVADSMTRDLVEGIDGTDVRAGIIGEIGTTDPLHPREEVVLRAAAVAHRRTGAPITIHTHPPYRYGHVILDLLEAEDVSLDRVVLGHLDGTLAQMDLSFDEAVQHHKSLAERGAYIEYDLCGNNGFFQHNGLSWWLPSDQLRVTAIRQLVAAGLGRKILVAHDVGHKHYLTRYGGWGYGHILRTMVPMLRAAGVDHEAIHTILVENPARMLAWST